MKIFFILELTTATLTFHHDMVKIKASQFTTHDEPTDRTLKITVEQDFLIDQFEVSNSQFKHFVSQTGYVTDAEKFGWSFVLSKFTTPESETESTEAVLGASYWLKVEQATWKSPFGKKSTYIPSHPVVHVSWRDAEAYCKYAIDGRLPSEDEWELAARGGKENRSFPWGNKFISSKLNIWNGVDWMSGKDEDGYETTAPVEAFGPQNNYAIYNIVGNVWEMTADDYYSDRSTKKPAKPTDQQEKVKKGGSFLCHEKFCHMYRVNTRSSNSADSSAQNLGFRCASQVKEHISIHVHSSK